MSKLNIELFKKVRDRIAATPESYDQDRWIRQSSQSPCGYAACLAGETIICNAPTVQQGIAELRRLSWADDDTLVANTAAELLGLDGDYSDFGNETDIFASSGQYWPEPFRSQFQSGDESGAAIAYLDWIIANNQIFPDDEHPTVTGH